LTQKRNELEADASIRLNLLSIAQAGRNQPAGGVLPTLKVGFIDTFSVGQRIKGNQYRLDGPSTEREIKYRLDRPLTERETKYRLDVD
jgi:hypothetical protein